MSSMSNVDPNPPFGFVQPWFPGVVTLYTPSDGLRIERFAEDGLWFGGRFAVIKCVYIGNRNYAYPELTCFRG